MDFKPALHALAFLAVGMHSALAGQLAPAGDPRFGNGTGLAETGMQSFKHCALGDVVLTVGKYAMGTLADGRLLAIADYEVLYSLLGTRYGGDGITNFALPDLRPVTPNGLTYSVCTEGVTPQLSH